MERVSSQDEIVRNLWGINNGQPFIQRVPSLNTLLGPGTQPGAGGTPGPRALEGGEVQAGGMSGLSSVDQHQQQQHVAAMERVQSMDLLRKYLGSQGDLTQLMIPNNAAAAQAAAQAAVHLSQQQKQFQQQQEHFAQQFAAQVNAAAFTNGALTSASALIHVQTRTLIYIHTYTHTHALSLSMIPQTDVFPLYARSTFPSYVLEVRQRLKVAAAR